MAEGKMTRTGKGVGMTDLHTALTLLQESFGELDNIKLMLNDTDGKKPEDVEREILRLARGIRSGEYAPQKTIGESALKNAVVAL